MLSPPSYRSRSPQEPAIETGMVSPAKPAQHTFSQRRTSTPKQQQRRCETSRCTTQDLIGQALLVRQMPSAVVKRFISSPAPVTSARDRSPSPVLQARPGKPQMRVERPHEGLQSCEPDHVNRTMGGTIQSELKELKNILEHQYLQDQSFATTKANLLPHAAKQVQSVQTMTSTASEGRFREMCANVACQQAEQEVFIRILRENVDELQQQIKSMSPANQVSAMEKEELSLVQEQKLVLCEQKGLDVETKETKDNIEGKMSKQAVELKSWFAEFCVVAMKDTLGEELQRHAEAIQYLNTQVDSLSDVTRNSFSSLRHSEAIKSLNLQVDYLNEVTTQSLAALQALIKQVVSGALQDQQPQEKSEPLGFGITKPTVTQSFQRKLDPIDETSSEEVKEMRKEMKEMPTWVKTIYQDALTQHSSRFTQSSIGTESDGNSYPEHSKGA
mmetsp:Transcript_157745/g.278492  ORF Transcript_157745/g.278492 Transcript_157745/m.278492 type:complete len:444 (+) Transcript_157745:49-1380(+)